MNGSLKMNVTSPPQVNLINLSRCARGKGGRRTYFASTLCTPVTSWPCRLSHHRTMHQTSSGPWKEFTWLSLPLILTSGLSISTWGAPLREHLLVLVFLFLIKILGYLYLKKNHPPPNWSLKLRSQNTVSHLGLSLWSCPLGTQESPNSPESLYPQKTRAGSTGFAQPY